MERHLSEGGVDAAMRTRPPQRPLAPSAGKREEVVLALQRTAGNAVVRRLLRGGTIARPSVQRVLWSWDGAKWLPQEVTNNPPPGHSGKFEYDEYDDAAVGADVGAGAGAGVAVDARLVYDTHGDKHFKGQDSQWDDGKKTVNAMLEADINGMQALLRKHATPEHQNNRGVCLFYFQNTLRNRVGKLDGKNGDPTRSYVIQIDFNVSQNTIGYHGYPVSETNPDGLGYTAKKKGLK